jgi:hypothetical protein
VMKKQESKLRSLRFAGTDECVRPHTSCEGEDFRRTVWELWLQLQSAHTPSVKEPPHLNVRCELALIEGTVCSRKQLTAAKINDSPTLLWGYSSAGRAHRSQR